MRIKRGTTIKAKHNKIRKSTKGMQAARRASIKLGKQGATKALQYAYRDRRATRSEIFVRYGSLASAQLLKLTRLAIAN